MAKVIAVVGQKGGVGKSTVARLLAVEAEKRGMRAKIMDLDPAQATCVTWKSKRDESGQEPEVSAETARTVEAALRHRDRADVLILDGRAFADRMTGQMAKAADLVILPTGFGDDDLRPQVTLAYALEDEGVPSAALRFVFVRARGSESEERDARRYIASAGLSVSETTLRELPAIRQAHNVGRAASEAPFATVATEARQLADELLALVAQPA